MKQLDLSAVTSSNRFPLKEGTFDFLQYAYTEGIRAAINAFIGESYDQGRVYILYGCIATVSGGTTTISAGVLYADDEFYYVTNQSFGSPTGGTVIIGNLQVNNYTSNADPVTFTDGVARNVHHERVCVFTTGASGSGTLSLGGGSQNDFNNFVSLQPAVEVRSAFNGDTLTFERSRVINYSTSLTGTVTATIDPTNARPGCEIVVYASIVSGATITFTGSGFWPIFNVGATVAGANRRTFKIRCIALDTDNVFGAGANAPMLEISGMNDA